MHELSIAVSIVEGALEEAERRTAGQVQAVHIRVGPLAGVDKDALVFSYGIACQGTAMAESRLVIEDVEVAIFCSRCGAERRAFYPPLVCVECGELGERVVRGAELEITALEMVA
jgi:hydrogenase nickel incorporation protein HypA/HybF